MELEKYPGVALVYIENSEGKILCVSRKDDHNQFGIIGGKLEEGETFEEAAIREAKEEVGLDIYNLKIVHEGLSQSGRRWCKYFICDYTGEVSSEEPHLIKWLTLEELMENSPFYDKLLIFLKSINKI